MEEKVQIDIDNKLMEFPDIENNIEVYIMDMELTDRDPIDMESL